MKFKIEEKCWEMVAPFVTSSETIHAINALTLHLQDGPHVGRAETLGVDYLGETATSLRQQLEAIRSDVERGINLEDLQALLPAGGARNGLDCALWDLECKRSRQRAWELLGMTMHPVQTVYTLSLDTTEAMAAAAERHKQAPHLKLKLDANDTADKIRAIRRARPDAAMVIDANGGWNPTLMDQLADVLAANRIAMLEQPLPRGEDEALKKLIYPIPICADESCQSSSELEQVAARYSAVNIKLDKCGGLTDALKIVGWCRAHGKQIMVGNMLGSSLAMAPAMLIAQCADLVDLDGPLWQTEDVQPPIRFEGTTMYQPEAELWG